MPGLPQGRRPRILLSNDDGVDSPGIWALYQAISAVADTLVVAPVTERSATGHAISVYNHVSLKRHIREETDWGYGLDGTPADCVKMALSTIMKDAPPDLVISGINRGQNTGNSIIYSGTVAAALEATMNGFPSIAISLAILSPFKGEPIPKSFFQEGGIGSLGQSVTDYQPAASFAARLALTAIGKGLPSGVLLNVNVPMLPENELKGVAISKMGQSVFVDEFQVVSEENGMTSYRNVGDRLIQSTGNDDWDDLIIHQDKISITPLHYDMTHHAFMDQLKQWALEEEKLARQAGEQVAMDLGDALNAETQDPT